MITKLKYGNTNTFFVSEKAGGLLVDTDYAGTLSSFYRAIKEHGIKLSDITYILATHYHPDHIGLVSELMSQNIKLLLIDTQVPYIHFADKIFERDKRLNFKSIDIENATVIRPEESRAFLKGISINGEIVSTPSHSQDSVSLILDSGECFVGDLEPMEYLDGYQLNESLQNDWERIKSYSPRVINYAHANQKIIKQSNLNLSSC